MAFRQITTPNLGVNARRGWCLQFVDDAVSAPNPSRQPSAQAALNVERANGNVRGGDPPIGVWVPIFFSLTAGPYRGLGHVAWAFNHGNGWIEIHDSETRPAARAVYQNINQVLAWFANHGIVYQGWSFWVDGVRVIEEYEPPKPVQPSKEFTPAKGTAKVTVNALNVRNEPNTEAGITAVYSNGQTFNYDGYVIANGYVWLSYVSYGGVRRYIAEGPADNDPKNVYLSGGVSR